MTEKFKLSREESMLLTKLNNVQLRALVELADHKSFDVLTGIVNKLIDLEKNLFFTENEIDPTRLSIVHAYSRGGIAKLTSFLRIIVGAKRELASREEKSKS